MPAIPPELMQAVGGAPGGGGGAAPGGGGSPPVGAPMSAPQENAGEKQTSMLQVQQAMDLLEQALPAFGSESEEGKTILGALSAIGKKFGGEKRARSKELMPAELMNLLSSLPQGPGGMKMPGAGGPPGGGAPGGAQPPPM